MRRSFVPSVPLSACLILTVAAIAMSGCATVAPRNPVPEDQVSQATIPGIPEARRILDPFAFDLNAFDASLGAAAAQIGSGRPLTLMAISGGGANGAYGAGVLKGLTESGTRPEYDIVTGVSTGGLIAPLAFLGQAYDDDLETAYTTIDDDHIFLKRRLFQLMRHRDAIRDSTPLSNFIAASVDAALLDAIAAEHAKGRRLFVASVDLDSQQLAAWDMGAIASSAHPGRVDLFRKVMLASASIPVAFPPVLLDVEAGGQRYEEMHVDGGVITQVFGPAFLATLVDLTHAPGGSIHLIRNSRLASEWSGVPARLRDIGGKSLSTITKAQGVGDLIRAYAVARDTGLEFRFTGIPAEFDMKQENDFDPVYMRALFDIGYQRAKEGSAWASVPPGMYVTEDGSQ